MPVPVASTAIADIVVTTLDKALQSTRATRADTTRAIDLLGRLEQSILARAFRGELVPQDPADNHPDAGPIAESITPVSTRRGRRTAA